METFKDFSKKLDKASQDSEEVLIELSSPGGDSYAALAYASAIRKYSYDLTVEAYGLVASAAVLVLAAGGIRLMNKESWVMVHENSGTLEGNVLELEREAGQLRRLEVQWAEILASVTKTKAEVWTALHKETTYLSAEQCLALGLIDRII